MYTVIYYIICAVFLFIGLLAYHSPESLFYISPYYWYYTDNEDAEPSEYFVKRTKFGGVILIILSAVLVVISIVLLILNHCGNNTVSAGDFIKSFVEYTFLKNRGHWLVL